MENKETNVPTKKMARIKCAQGAEISFKAGRTFVCLDKNEVERIQYHS